MLKGYLSYESMWVNQKPFAIPSFSYNHVVFNSYLQQISSRSGQFGYNHSKRNGPGALKMRKVLESKKKKKKKRDR